MPMYMPASVSVRTTPTFTVAGAGAPAAAAPPAWGAVAALAAGAALAPPDAPLAAGAAVGFAGAAAGGGAQEAPSRSRPNASAISAARRGYGGVTIGRSSSGRVAPLARDRGRLLGETTFPWRATTRDFWRDDTPL